MKQNVKNKYEPVDKGLIREWLKMTPEERLKANDNAVRTVLELRDGFRKQTAK